MQYPKQRSGLIQKRSFLLLELLVAFTLFTLCLVPLIQPHLRIGLQERKDLISLQLTQHADRALCEIKESLMAHTYEWKDLLDNNVKDEQLTTNYEVFLGGDTPQLFMCSFTLKKYDKCFKTLSKWEGLALKAILKFSPEQDGASFTRMIYLENHTSKSSGEYEKT
ncbi:MAG: hypothetical protein K940chlam9_00706 [Chlamydiae bacterium]|nr:hypothetical protein [Chlamydiota bacterium]